MTNILLQSLNRYYNNGKNIEQFNDYVNGEKKISLRIIDWFVTNYSKKYNILLEQNQFNIYLNYKKQLKAYTKKQFDPFCRRFRINYCYNDRDDNIITTIGQLNFFRWVIKTKVLDWIINNQNLIEQDMNLSYKKTSFTKKKISKNVCVANKFNKHKLKITLYF